MDLPLPKATVKSLAEARVKEAEALLLSHSDICRTLQDELSEEYEGCYCYVCDVFGDSESGDVVYSAGGKTLKASYEIGQANGKRTCSIDTENATEVLPRTVYDEEAEEADEYNHMEAAQREAKYVERFPGSSAWPVPFTERFISKGERDSMPSEDFAGKGKSFPIKKASDVMAAVRSLGRAGSGNHSIQTLKANIKKIAKRKGFALPKAWKDDEEKVAAADRPVTAGELVLVESALCDEEIPLTEAARTDYEVKLIAPGKGSSAFYPVEVLKRDGPKVFTAGTHMYLNHPTDAEEAARPEGDVDKLAGVLTRDAEYKETGKHGAGLYSRMKVFSDYATQVSEKGPHIGLSIRASGKAESGKMQEGRPVLKELTHAESVDLVTKAGAGGLILQESATHTQESDMDEAKLLALIDTRVKEANAPLLIENQRLKDQLAMLTGPQVVREALKDIRLPDACKDNIVGRLATHVPLTEAGTVDQEKLNKLVETEAQHEADFLMRLNGGVRVTGMGTAHPITEADRVNAAKQFDEARDGSMKDLATIFCGEGKGSKKLRKAFIAGRQVA